jgi:predicted dehydrogenase
MKFGIVGIGNHAMNRVIPAIVQSGNEIYAISTQNQEKGEQVSEKFKCEYISNFQDLLKSPIDALYIGSPNFMHFEHAKKALLHGKHVLVEKQMTLRSADAKELNNISTERKVKLAVGFHLRMHPALSYIKKNILNPDEAILYQAGNWTHKSNSVSNSDDRKWWSEPDKVGGGSVMGTGVHVIDTIVSFGNRFPRRVTAFRIPEEKIIDDTMSVNMQFEKGFAVAISSRSMEPVANDLITLTESKKIVAKNFFGTSVDTSIEVNGEKVKSFEGGNLYSDEISEFVKCVNNEPSKIATGNDGYRVVRIVEEAQKSIAMAR